MITVKLADILNDKIEDLADDFSIYAVRDGEIIIYVGKSKRCVTDRILDHCGLGSWSSGLSGLGQVIADNKPASLEWQVDLMTIADCEPLIKKHFPSYKNWNIDTAERATIYELKPCLNVTDNRSGNRLPQKYIKQNLTDAPCDVLGLDISGD